MLYLKYGTFEDIVDLWIHAAPGSEEPLTQEEQDAIEAYIHSDKYKFPAKLKIVNEDENRYLQVTFDLGPNDIPEEE